MRKILTKDDFKIEKNKNYLLWKDENHPQWKGDKVSYSGLHHWIMKKLGKIKECVYCGLEKNIQWASISHKAKRDKDDYIPLCASCHKKYDKSQIGSRHGMAKLTEEQIVSIRELYNSKKYTLTVIAKRFNVTPQNIFLIVKRKAWLHI